MSALGPTSGALIALAAVVSGVLIVVTLVTWRRAARPGARHVLVRFGLLLANNLAVTSLIFLSVNRVMGFYASWAEMLGTSTSTGVVRAAPSESGSPAATDPTGVGTGGSQSGPPGPLGTGSPQPDTQAWTPAGGSITVLSTRSLVTGSGHGAGELQRVRVHGGRSGLGADGYVYLPPQYAAASGSGHQLGVVLVISNSVSGSVSGSGPGSGPGSSSSAARDLALTAYGQVTAGHAAPAIYVMLPATIAPGDQACLDVPAGPQAGMFFSQDLPAVVRAAYRSPGGPAGWGLLGDSAGGYCALHLALASSDRFAVAAAPAGDYQTPPGIAARPGGTATTRAGGPASEHRGTAPATGPWLFGGSPLLQNEANLVWRLREMPPPPVTVTFTAASSADLGQARAFLSEVRPPMKAGTIIQAPGAHGLAPVIDRVSRELSSWG